MDVTFDRDHMYFQCAYRDCTNQPFKVDFKNKLTYQLSKPLDSGNRITDSNCKNCFKTYTTLQKAINTQITTYKWVLFNSRTSFDN